MLYVAKLHAYAVLHVCECKDKARQSKNKRFQFLWQYVAGVCRLQRISQLIIVHVFVAVVQVFLVVFGVEVLIQAVTDNKITRNPNADIIGFQIASQ